MGVDSYVQVAETGADFLGDTVQRLRAVLDNSGLVLGLGGLVVALVDSTWNGRLPSR